MGLISGDGKRRAVLRKTFPSMKVSTYLVLKDIIKDWGVPVHENKTDHFFEVGDNRLYYLSLDDPEKIKGAEFVDIWLEEATEFDEDDFKQLRIRLSRDKRTENAVIWLSYNPIEEHHWCVKFADYAKANDKERVLVHHSTYKDNKKNLSNAFIEELERLQEIDENFYRIYTLGEPGVLKNKIYDNVRYEDRSTWPSHYQLEGMHCYGLDFGFNNPMALIEIWYYEGEYYGHELLYKSGMTTGDLIKWMDDHEISKTDDIFCDSAEPDRIEELCNNGYNAKPAKKDVKAGIDYCKHQVIHMSDTSVNMLKEDRNYKYKETKDGVVLDEPVKFLDHIEDARRYAMYTMSINRMVKYPTAAKTTPRFRVGGAKRPKLF